MIEHRACIRLAHVSLLIAALGLPCAALAPASAMADQQLKEQPGDKDAVQACEKRLCTMIVKKPAAGADLSCKLAKTWSRDNLNAGAATTKVGWGFGDARCSLDLNVTRDTIVAALSQPEYTFEVPQHTVDCYVDQNGKPEHARVTLAPKIKFKSGEAKTVWLNVKKIEGPSAIKAVVWSVVRLEDSVGIFHKPMIKEINKFVQKKCSERYSKG